MSNILDVAKNAKEIMGDLNIKCPTCGQKQYSPFDKLFTKAYDKCVDCTPVSELEEQSDNIFALVEAM
jgi:uncharacterized protein (DUF983 family)